MNKKILILGGGVAGSSMAYYLTEKGYDVTIIEKNSKVGGLARTCYYSGHPYEFGPHIWFWPSSTGPASSGSWLVNLRSPLGRGSLAAHRSARPPRSN